MSHRTHIMIAEMREANWASARSVPGTFRNYYSTSDSRSCFFFVALTTLSPDDDSACNLLFNLGLSPSFSDGILTSASTKHHDSGDARGGLGKCDGVLLKNKYVCPSALSVSLWRTCVAYANAFHSFAEDSTKASWSEAIRAQLILLLACDASKRQNPLRLRETGFL